MAQYVVEDDEGRQYVIEGPDGLQESGPSRSAPPMPQAPPTALDGALSTARQVGASVASGAGQAASLYPLVASGMNPGPRMRPEVIRSFQEDMRERSERLRQNSLKLGEESGLPKGYGRTISESVGGGAAFGGITPLAIAGSIGSGAGSELAANTLGDSFLTRLLGGLVGSFGVAASGARVRNTKDLASQSLQGIDDATLKKAQAFQAQQAAQNITVDLAQALEAVGVPAGTLASVRNFLATNPNGLKVQETLHKQPGQLSMEGDQFAARLPGANRGQAQSANDLQEAATAAINAVKGERSSRVKSMYGAAGVLTPAQIKDLDQLAANFANQVGTTDDVKRAVAVFQRKLRGETDEMVASVEEARKALSTATDPKSRMAAQTALSKAKGELDAARNRPIAAGDVDTAIGEMAGPFKGTPLSPADPKAAGQMRGLAKAINQRFQTYSPEIAAAEREFARLSEALVNPVKQSVVGQIAKSTGYRADVQAQMNQFDTIMSRGSDASAKVSDIRTLGTQLAKVDKDAFSDALKSYVSRQIKAAMDAGGDSASAANNPDMAKRIAANLWGEGNRGELKAQGLRDAVAISAQVHGQNPAEVVRGLNNFMQLTKAMSSRPANVSGMRPDDIAQTGGRNMLSTGLRAFGIAPFATPANRSFEFVLNSTLSQFDTILTSPDGAKMLAALGREPVMSKRIPFILGQFGAQAATNPVGIMPE
jgi:hypothetical protein